MKQIPFQPGDLGRWPALVLFLLLFSGGVKAAEEPFKILNMSPADWATRLANSETLGEQRLAVFCLAEFGPEARQAVALLTQTAQNSRYPEVKELAVEALGAVGPEAASAVDMLLPLIPDERHPLDLRVKALDAVARISPERADVAAAVIKALGSTHAELRLVAMDAAATVVIFNPKSDALASLTAAARLTQNAEPAVLALRCLGAEGVGALMDVIERGDVASRKAAAEQLARMGELARPVMGPLIKAARREKVSPVRAAMLGVIAGLAPDDLELLKLTAGLLGDAHAGASCEAILSHAGGAAVPHLREALRMREPAARMAALRLCRDVREAAAPFVKDVVGLLRDKEEDVRLAAVEALAAMGTAAASAEPALKETAKSATGRLRDAAALAALNVTRPEGTPPRRTLLEVQPDEEVIRVLRQGESARVRIEAAQTLRGRQAGLEALMEALHDTDVDVRVAAAKALAFRAGEAKAAAKELAGWLSAPELKLQQAALAALTALGPDAPGATEAVVARAIRPDAPDDVETSSLLGYCLRAHGSEAAGLLAKALKNEDPRVARLAAESLSKLGPMAVAVHAELKQAALSTDEDVMKAAVDALCRLGPAAVEDVPMLVRFLSYAAPAWRSAAAEALGSIKLDLSNGDPNGVIEALLPVLLDPDTDISWSAYLALYLIGEPALPKLRWLMEINEGEIPFPALRVMAKLKADPEILLPKIVALSRPGHRAEERATAAELLGLYAPEQTVGIPALIEMLRARSGFVVRAARSALELFGRTAIPALEAAVRGRDPAIRKQALEALEQLRGAK